MKKALAITAVSGILLGSLVACGGDKGATEPPKTPSADPAAPGAKASCSATAAPGAATPAAPTGDAKQSCSAKK